jgi:hypothetical protein
VQMYLAKTNGNLNPRGEQPQSNMQVSTIRAFEGGLNVADTDLNMEPKFAKVLDNIERATDGSLSVRYGTRHLAVMPGPTEIVNHTYFANHIIAVQTDGSLTKTTGDGTVTQMLTGGVNLWPGGVAYVSFTIFNSDLIVTNGRDKPLIIKGKSTDPNFLIPQFLIDIATGSNVNVPVGKFVIAHGQYTCFAGFSAEPGVLYISARGTSGTYFGDPAPNDAIKLDLGPRVSLGSATITGLVAYRDKLLATFERGVLPLNLGVYTGSPQVHTPSDDGFIEEFGCLSHRSLTSIGDDTLFCDNIGVNSISRINMFNTLRPVRVSHLIDPLTTGLLRKLTQAQIDKYVFAVYDLRHFRYILFIPEFDAGGALVETTGFSYTNIPTLKIQAWARLKGWKWQSACRTALQNIIFSMGNRLYSYNFDPGPSDGVSDFFNDPTHDYLGVPVQFTWELPWADFKRRMDIKQTRYIALDTRGTGTFLMEAYTDNFMEIDSTSGPVAVPALSMTLDAGNSQTGARPTTLDERLLAWTTKFKLLKLKFSGSTKLPIKFVSVSIAYVKGGVRR